MHLLAQRPQRVSIPGRGEWEIADGESIRTEISCKYDRESLTGLIDESRLELERWESDEGGGSRSP